MRTWDRLRALDQRLMDSKLGWLLPGGFEYKLGQRDRSENERWWVYLLGPLRGWNYNAGRERAARDRDRPN
jgi:hypothetical protein